MTFHNFSLLNDKPMRTSTTPSVVRLLAVELLVATFVPLLVVSAARAEHDAVTRQALELEQKAIDYRQRIRSGRAKVIVNGPTWSDRERVWLLKFSESNLSLEKSGGKDQLPERIVKTPEAVIVHGMGRSQIDG